MARLPMIPRDWTRLTAPLALALFLVMTVSCGRAPQVDGEGGAPTAAPPGPGAVAVVNGEEITVEDYAGELAAAAFMAKSATVEGRMEVLDGMIDKLLLAQDARAQGILQRPMVQLMIERLRRRYALQELRRTLALEVPEPSPEEIDAIIGEPKETVDLTVLLAYDEEKAAEAIARIEAGEPMEDVAREISIAPGAAAGGASSRTGFQRGSGMYPPEVEEQVFNLEVGEISPPMLTPVGLLVARLDARHVQSEEELEALRPGIIAGWKRQQLVKALEEEKARRRREAEISILVEHFHDAPLPDKDLNIAVIWRALEGIDIARVNGTLLTMGDLFRNTGDYLRLLKKREGYHDQVYRNTLEENIDQVLLLEAARERGLADIPTIDAVIDRYTTRLLQAQAMVDLALTVIEEDIDEEKCERFYEERKNRFPVPPVFTLSQILVRRKEKADEVLSRYQAGESFESLAQNFSADPSAVDGGDLGTVLADELIDMLGEEGVDALLAGARRQQQKPLTIRTLAGYRLFLIRDFIEAGEGGFANVRERVLPDYLDFCRREAVTEHVKNLRKKASIAIDREKVAGVEPAAVAPAGSAPHGSGGAPGGGAFNPHGGGAPGGTP